MPDFIIKSKTAKSDKPSSEGLLKSLEVLIVYILLLLLLLLFLLLLLLLLLFFEFFGDNLDKSVLGDAGGEKKANVMQRSDRLRKMLVCSATILTMLVSATATALIIETVPVGNTGNGGEISGISAAPGPGGWGPDRTCGAVGHEYNIGKYEVTAGQYAEFLNAVAVTDAHGLYNEDMWSSDVGCKIERTSSASGYSYVVAAEYADRPVNYVSWGDAARFANWLHNGEPTTGLQDASTTEDGSYSLNGTLTAIGLKGVTRNTSATWVIPSEDEWYKAAYHMNDGVTGNYYDYPTGGNTVSTAEANYGWTFTHTVAAGSYAASPSPYGTFDQGGNVWEWTEVDPISMTSSVRGGSYENQDRKLQAAFRDYYDTLPTNEYPNAGFRVAEIPGQASPVPEPAGLGFIGLALLAVRKKRQ